MARIDSALCQLLLLGCFLPLTVAHAKLGDHEEGIARDRSKLKATSKITVTENYTVHELSSPANTVREYVSQSGDIFAVTWSGIKRPDLQALFGEHYTKYVEAAREQMPSKGRHVSRVSVADLVVERGGHMRDIHGRAYLKDLVPEGVDPEALP